VGLGEEYGLRTAGLAGAVLVAQGLVSHLTAFPSAEAWRRSDVAEMNQDGHMVALGESGHVP